jgi:hypothetical protein
MLDFAIQAASSSVKDLLRDAAKADETIIYAENGELARLLWERIGNADVAKAPSIDGVLLISGVEEAG